MEGAAAAAAGLLLRIDAHFDARQMLRPRLRSAGLRGSLEAAAAGASRAAPVPSVADAACPESRSCRFAQRCQHGHERRLANRPSTRTRAPASSISIAPQGTADAGSSSPLPPSASVTGMNGPATTGACRASLRHLCRRPPLTPCRRATAEMFAPGSKLSDTIRAFSSSLHRRCRSPAGSPSRHCASARRCRTRLNRRNLPGQAQRGASAPA
jgi:hypothetical protein